MDHLLLVTILLLVTVALLLVAYPLWQQERSPQALSFSNPESQALEDYQVRYQAVLASIKTLVFDYETGKVSDEDYDRLLAEAKLEAAELRRQIDQVGDETGPAAGSSPAPLDAQVEALIAQFRNGAGPHPTPLLQEVEAEIEALKTLRPEPAERAAVAQIACTGCGHALQADDAFCSRCGQPVEVAPESAADIAAPHCPACGHSVQPDDAYCVKCGAAIPQPESVGNPLR